MSTKFRKRPIVVEAVQFTGANYFDVDQFVGATLKRVLESETAYVAGKGAPIFSLIIQTEEGNMKAMPGDWVIKGIKGEFYPCKPDIFEKTYIDDAIPNRPLADVFIDLCRHLRANNEYRQNWIDKLREIITNVLREGVRPMEMPDRQDKDEVFADKAAQDFMDHILNIWVEKEPIPEPKPTTATLEDREITVIEAMNCVIREIRRDEDYRNSWIANIAMALYDQLSEEDEKNIIRIDRSKKNIVLGICNKAADRFLQMLCATRNEECAPIMSEISGAAKCDQNNHNWLLFTIKKELGMAIIKCRECGKKAALPDFDYEKLNNWKEQGGDTSSIQLIPVHYFTLKDK